MIYIVQVLDFASIKQRHFLFLYPFGLVDQGRCLSNILYSLKVYDADWRFQLLFWKKISDTSRALLKATGQTTWNRIGSHGYVGRHKNLIKELKKKQRHKCLIFKWISKIPDLFTNHLMVKIGHFKVLLKIVF